MKTYKALLLIAVLVACHTCELFGQVRSQTCELHLDSAQSAQFQAGFTTSPGVLNLKGVSAVTTPGTAANLKMINDAGSGRIEFKTGGAQYEKVRALITHVNPGYPGEASSIHYFASDSILFFSGRPTRTRENVTMVISPRYQKLSDKEKSTQLQVMQMFIDSEKKKLKSK